MTRQEPATNKKANRTLVNKKPARGSDFDIREILMVNSAYGTAIFKISRPTVKHCGLLGTTSNRLRQT
jgi:hypothetical protein